MICLKGGNSLSTTSCKFSCYLGAPQSDTILTFNLRSADDKSVRYVAEENITVLSDTPTQNLLELAGRYFKRWDSEEKVFVSNIRDEYPQD